MGTRLSGREIAIIFAFWTALATLSAVNTLLDPRGYGLRLTSPAGPIAMAYVESWLWAAFTPFIFSMASRFSFEIDGLSAGTYKVDASTNLIDGEQIYSGDASTSTNVTDKPTSGTSRRAYRVRTP